MNGNGRVQRDRKCDIRHFTAATGPAQGDELGNQCYSPEFLALETIHGQKKGLQLRDPSYQIKTTLE